MARSGFMIHDSIEDFNESFDSPDSFFVHSFNDIDMGSKEQINGIFIEKKGVSLKDIDKVNLSGIRHASSGDLASSGDQFYFDVDDIDSLSEKDDSRSGVSL